MLRIISIRTLLQKIKIFNYITAEDGSLGQRIVTICNE